MSIFGSSLDALPAESAESGEVAALLLFTDAELYAPLLTALRVHRLTIVECVEPGALLVAIREHPFPLVLVDPDYPGLHDALRRLRPRESAPDGLVAVCLDAAREAAMPELVAAGVEDFIRTDVGSSFLESQIALLLKRLDHRRSWRRAERALRRHAYYDSLTGLPNRAGLHEELTKRLLRIRQTPHRRVAVLHLDLDRLKVVNESLGRAAGDELLRQVGRRLGEGTKAGDLLARTGGDAFSLVTEVGLDPAEIEVAVGRLESCLSAPLHLGSRSLVLTASIGIALGDAETRSVEDLLRNASTAMFRAKSEGGGGRAMFDDRMHAEAVARLQVETELRDALDREELAMYMQPIYDLAAGTVEAFECLVRWRHPRRGLLAPDAFLPVAEETGLIVQIDDWMLQQAWATIGDWYRRRIIPPQGITVSVNLSHRQLLQPDLVDRVRQLLERETLDPSRLALELTEGVMSEADDGRMMRRIRAVGELGVDLWIDDFGTGYSSLSQLHRLRVDLLKIDGSFVSAIAVDADTHEIVRAILALAHALGRGTVAEGVETEEQRRALLDLGCRFGQGNLYSEPLACDQAERLLRSQCAQATAI